MHPSDIFPGAVSSLSSISDPGNHIKKGKLKLFIHLLYRPSILWVKLKGCKWLLISYWILLVYRTKWKAICKENCPVYLMSLRVFFRAPRLPRFQRDYRDLVEISFRSHHMRGVLPRWPRSRQDLTGMAKISPRWPRSRRDGWDLAKIIGISPRSRQYLAKCKILGKIFAEISPRSQPLFRTWQDLTEISRSARSLLRSHRDLGHNLALGKISARSCQVESHRQDLCRDLMEISVTI